MTLKRRLAKLEAARGARPDPDAAARLAAWVEALDELEARKTAGCPTVQRELEELVAALEEADDAAPS